ncbi:hypothetical protein EVAR_97758_1 [Eumeta japonica]|uniref:Uncharacterized protein n=1 Tax=Eumeta variegata TaxID=151549 RepID=A0A4C1X623_EUMVA|nr:hypothetical protein EVAR_97758_1 [Eumeta japonica]
MVKNYTLSVDQIRPSFLYFLQPYDEKTIALAGVCQSCQVDRLLNDVNEMYFCGNWSTNCNKSVTKCVSDDIAIWLARGRPIIVEWERDARHSAGLSLVRTSKQRSRVRRYNATELLAILAESSRDEGEFVASDNEHDYTSLVEEGRLEISDVEPEAEVENEIDSYDSDASFEGKSFENILIVKDETW